MDLTIMMSNEREREGERERERMKNERGMRQRREREGRLISDWIRWKKAVSRKERNRFSVCVCVCCSRIIVRTNN